MAAEIRRDLSKRTSKRFDSLLASWKKRYGTRAVEPLLGIAADRKLSDPDRYIALMGSARLGGPAIAPRLTPLLKDKSWMVRSAALQALRFLGNREAAPHVLALLKDPALVVRSEAVQTVEALRPEGAVPALVDAATDEANYHAGKARWVPQKALAALVKLEAPGSVARELRPLLDYEADPELVRQTIRTLEAITGRSPASAAVPLSDSVRAWKATLSEP